MESVLTAKEDSLNILSWETSLINIYISLDSTVAASIGWVNIACTWQIYIDIGLQLSKNPNTLGKNMGLSVPVDFMELGPQGQVGESGEGVPWHLFKAGGINLW